MHFAGNYTGVDHEPGLRAREAGAFRPLGKRRPGPGARPLAWASLALPRLGDLWRFTALPAFSHSASLGAALAPRRISPPAISGFLCVEASPLQNEKRKPRPAGGVGGRTRRVATAWDPQRPRGRSPRGTDPDLNFSASGRPRSPPQPGRAPHPPQTHRRRAPLYARPRGPFTAGPHPPPTARAARPPPAGSSAADPDAPKAVRRLSDPNFGLPERYNTLREARTRLRRPLPEVPTAGPGAFLWILETCPIHRGRDWISVRTFRPDDSHPRTRLGGVGMGAGSWSGEESAALSCWVQLRAAGKDGWRGPASPPGRGSRPRYLCLTEKHTHAHTYTLTAASTPKPDPGHGGQSHCPIHSRV